MVSIHTYRHGLIHCTHDHFIHATSSMYIYYIMHNVAFKWEKWTEKLHCHTKGQKYSYAYYIHPRSPNFHPFRSTMSRLHPFFSVKCTKWPKMTHIFVVFPVRSACSSCDCQFCEKCIKWPKNNIAIFKVNSTHMHTTNTPDTQIFLRFAILWAVFELCIFFQINTPSDSKWTVQGQKYQYAYYRDSPRLKLVFYIV